MNSIAEPPLAPQGAGLPGVELVVARMLFRWRRLTGNRESFNARFQREREQIRRLVAGLSEEDAGRRVLIQRPPGLEDSSRFWSAWMTLDHMRIVHGGIVRVIGALKNGVTPPGAASTAAVKPSAAVASAVVVEYEKSCDEVLAVSEGELRTKARYAHPWFGPLDAAGWYAMAAVHIGLRRVQMERICAGSREIG